MAEVESIGYRQAEEADCDEIVRLWLEMMSEHSELDPRIRLSPTAADAYAGYVKYHLGSRDTLCIVAQTAAGADPAAIEGPGSPLVGYCLSFISQNLPMFVPSRFGFISDMAVAPSQQRKEIGSKMVNQVRQWLKRRKIKCVQLQVYSQNPTGKNFWVKQGFTNFYDRMWMDL